MRVGTGSPLAAGPPDRVRFPASEGEDWRILATRLSGQTALLLGWRPDDFWNATPAELAAILQALAPQSDAVADAATLTTLMEQFPDAPNGGH